MRQPQCRYPEPTDGRKYPPGDRHHSRHSSLALGCSPLPRPGFAQTTQCLPHRPLPALPDNQHPLRRQQRVRARALNALNLRQPLGLLRRYDSALRQTVRKIPGRIPSGLAREEGTAAGRSPPAWP
jgi:hypothetical protein